MNSYELLKKACKQHGQREVARRLHRSPASINRILKGTYPNPKKILIEVYEMFNTSAKVVCPTLGEIHRDVCKRYCTWAQEDRVHHERLYNAVKEHCLTCKEKQCH